MFCVECGSTDKKMVGDICIDCFLKDFQMIEIPENITVKDLAAEMKKTTAVSATKRNKQCNKKFL